MQLRSKQTADQIRQKFGQIDILVNCAGGDVGSQGAMGENAGKPLSNDAVFIAMEDVRTVLDRNILTCIIIHIFRIPLFCFTPSFACQY